MMPFNIIMLAEELFAFFGDGEVVAWDGKSFSLRAHGRLYSVRYQETEDETVSWGDMHLIDGKGFWLVEFIDES